MVFDSRSENCKFPYGAVVCGTAVTFSLRPDRAEGFSSCTLLLTDDFSGSTEECSLDAVSDGFSGVYTAPGKATLLWYVFCFSRADGSCILYGLGGYGDETPYQLTVYSEAFPVPDWFGRGTTYQIFPDRFCRLYSPSVAGLLGSRVLHERWEDTPVYMPDQDGVVRNCDFFGGSLAGITEKLPYLASLHVSTLYLNPIFLAASNHRYDTADYLKIDPLLGTEDDFRLLCRRAGELGIRVMLDGVFNHTGSDSLYFNALGSFETVGAAQSPFSQYADWYTFREWPQLYDAWWGIRTLPAVNENNEEYRRYIISGEDSVIRHWLRCGASAWRLDVADELPDDFIAQLRAVVAEESPDCFLLGEVWEDASNKIAYSRRRRYLLGEELCGVMNYPFRTAAIAYLTGGDADAFRECMESLRENYPRFAYYSAMNSLGTHDTPRILTLLGTRQRPTEKSERASFCLSPEELSLGISRLRLGAMLLYCFPGSPTIYYGDEAGVQGFEDPLNRTTFPWGHENISLLSLYRSLGALRSESKALQCGAIEYLYATQGLLVFRRVADVESVICALNAGDAPISFSLPCAYAGLRDAVSSQLFLSHHGTVTLTLSRLDGMILQECFT